MFGPQDLLLFGGLALLIFGPKKLPELSRSLGKSIAEFKKGAQEVTRDIGEAARVDLARAAELEKPASTPIPPSVSDAPVEPRPST